MRCTMYHANQSSQDPETSTWGGPPSFLIRLTNDDELTFHFTFIIRQVHAPQSIYNVNSANTITSNSLADSVINGLTFVFASSSKELENLVKSNWDHYVQAPLTQTSSQASNQIHNAKEWIFDT